MQLHSLQVASAGQALTRKMRMPNFPIQGGFNAMGLYPYFFAPLLPGETLEEHTLKATVVSAPLASPLGGAWCETWLFYVKLTDLDPALAEMFIGSLTSTSGYTAGADRPHYFTKSGQLDWCKMCTELVHEKFFRNEGETLVAHPDGVPMIKRINSDVFESAVQDASGDASDIGDSEGEAITDQMYAYLRMKQMGMGAQSYEQYLKTYGLKTADLPTRGEPELFAYRRYWSAPSNVINPSDGAPTGAWYWRLDEKNEKPKRVAEPGFVIGFWAVRPKFLDAKHVAPYTSSLWGFEQWVPSYTLEDPQAGLREIDANAQPWVTEDLSGSVSLWIDHRDLHVHGEQFRNGGGRYTPALSNGRVWSGSATNPELRGEYVLSTDIDALWADDAVAEGFDYDGIVTLKIKGHVMDNTK